MKNLIRKSLVSAGLVLILSGIYFNALSQNTGAAVKLVYNYPVDKAIKYLNNTVMAQIMDMQGQSMQVDVTSAFGCSVRTAGKQDNNLKIEIRIDTLGQTTNSPMGGSGGAIQDIKGNTCNIIISPEGKIIDMSETAKLVYTTEGSGQSNMSQNLSDFFPVLPTKPVTTGDTWNMTDSVTVKSTSMTMKTLDNIVSKLEGFETVNGIECAKISGVHSGTITMNVQNQGMDIFIKGPFTGTSEFWFAIKEGYFIKLSSATKVTGNLEISSPETMSMPIVLDIKSVNEVMK
jgi:hypothetical protein